MVKGGRGSGDHSACGEEGTEFSQCAVQTLLGGGRPGSCGERDTRDREALPIAQEEDVAVGGGERAERGVEEGLGVRERAADWLRHRGDGRGAASLLPATAGALGPLEVGAGVVRRLVEPAGEGRGPRDPVSAAEQEDEDGLDDVIRVLRERGRGVAENAEGGCANGGQVLVHEVAEGVRRARGAELAEEMLVGRGGHQQVM
jgi:hypothetical protein